MSGMRECFEQYGADYKETMERFLHNETLYLRLLGKLFSKNETQKLGADLGAGDLRGAFETAHTLKGVAGNLGLTPLYGAVCALVEPLRFGEEGADYPLLYRAVLEEFGRAERFWNALKCCEPD